MYSVLIYDAEQTIEALPEADHQRRLDRHHAFQEPLRDSEKLAATVKLTPTTSAVSLKGGPIENAVIDGPYAETKEQLLGFYLIECASLEEAIAAARELPLESGTLEIRPVEFFEGGDYRHGQPLVQRRG